MVKQVSNRNWHKHWMQSAYHDASMSTCASPRKVGAVFVRDNRELISGFNGVPTKYPHPKACIRKLLGIPSGEKLHLCGCSHAEINGITNAARYGVSLLGSTVYCTSKPCDMCAGALANVGVVEVIYDVDFPSQLVDDIFKHAGIICKHISEYCDFEVYNELGQ